MVKPLLSLSGPLTPKSLASHLIGPTEEMCVFTNQEFILHVFQSLWDWTVLMKVLHSSPVKLAGQSMTLHVHKNSAVNIVWQHFAAKLLGVLSWHLYSLNPETLLFNWQLHWANKDWLVSRGIAHKPCDQVNLYIILKYGLFGCFNSMDGSVVTLLIHLNFSGDVWILSDYLNAMLLKSDGKNQISIFRCEVHINKHWIMKVQSIVVILSYWTLHILLWDITM